MKDIVEFLAKHGYWVLFVSVLGRQACLPVPACLVLLAGGALAGLRSLSFPGTIALSVTAFLLADLAWYGAGRKWGSRTLHFICGATQNPSACVRKIAETFSRRGVKSLLISKFIPGLDSVAAPMSGISGASLPQFLAFDAIGALLWSSLYTALGYVFSNQLDHVAMYIGEMGRLIGLLIAIAVVAGLGVLIVLKLVRWYRFLREFKLARITPDELKEQLAATDKILILDLQGSVKQAQCLKAIPGAVRIDPWELGRYIRQYRGMDLATDREVILYCDSPSETTSARVALALRRLGFARVRPLAGGFRAWYECGFPVTCNVEILPLAEHSVYVLHEILRYSRRTTAQLLKTSVANVDQLLERARKRLERTTEAHLLLLKSRGHQAPAESTSSVDRTASIRSASEPA
jgi:membrane protein DedA with SNARE-associated domain/rhodanese-related sulfurtransferase